MDPPVVEFAIVGGGLQEHLDRAEDRATNSDGLRLEPFGRPDVIADRSFVSGVGVHGIDCLDRRVLSRRLPAGGLDPRREFVPDRCYGFADVGILIFTEAVAVPSCQSIDREDGDGGPDGAATKGGCQSAGRSDPNIRISGERPRGHSPVTFTADPPGSRSRRRTADCRRRRGRPSHPRSNSACHSPECSRVDGCPRR
jgi:hypothetical protein